MRLGVIGGLGPMATAYYMELVVRMTDAQCDQDHPEMMILNVPTIPDRTAFILGKSRQDPVAPMVALGQMLRRMGADIIATPCVTAHYFHDALQQGIGLPVIHGIDCAVEVLKEAGVTRVGLMATDGTVESGIFQRKLEQANIQTVLPDKVGQVGVMELIYGQVKAGRPADLDLFYGIRDDLRCRGAQGVILGCTELSLLKKQGDLGNGILDVLDVLARKSVQVCGKTVRPEYECLFVPFGEKE